MPSCAVGRASVPGSAALRARAAAAGLRLREQAAGTADAPPAAVTRFGVTFPALLWDGATNTSVAIDAAANAASVSGGAGWGVQRVTVAQPAGHTLSWAFDASKPTVCRNGLIAPIIVESTISTGDPSLTLTLAPTAA